MSDVFIPDFTDQNLDQIEGGIRRGANFDTIINGVKSLSMSGKFTKEGVKEWCRLYEGHEKKNQHRRQMIARKQFEGGQKNKKSGMRATHVFDARTYLRWEQQNPGCWQDPKWVKKFEEDNPACIIK